MKTTNGKGKICIKRKKKVCKGSYGTWEIKKKCTVCGYRRGGSCGNEASRWRLNSKCKYSQ